MAVMWSWIEMHNWNGRGRCIHMCVLLLFLVIIFFFSIVSLMKYGTLTFEFKKVFVFFFSCSMCLYGILIVGSLLFHLHFNILVRLSKYSSLSWVVFSIWLESWNRLVIHMHCTIIVLRLFGVQAPHSLKTAKAVSYCCFRGNWSVM